MHIPHPARSGDRVRYRTIAGTFEATIGPTGRTLSDIKLVRPAQRRSPALLAYLEEGRLVPQLMCDFEIVARVKRGG